MVRSVGNRNGLLRVRPATMDAPPSTRPEEVKVDEYM
jgi:hypothetical protein